MQLVWPAPNRRFGIVDFLGVLGIAGLLVARYIPVARIIPFWGCAFRNITGWPCPGCGLTRVADRFSHFNFHGAFLANPLGAIAAGLLVVFAVWSFLHLVFKVPVPTLTLNDRDWRWVRNLAIVLATLNYLFVIARHRHWFA